MAHLLRATFIGTFVAVATLGACTLKTDGTGADSGPVGGQGAGGDAGEAGTGGAASEGGTGGVGGAGGAGGGIAGQGGSAGGGASGGGASGAGMSGGGAGGSAGASGTGGAPVCAAEGKAVNVVKCDQYQDCTNLEPPSCPPGGASCEIQCSNEESCLFATIDCNGASDCVVRCSGRRACRGANVLCGPGTCKVICGDETEDEDDSESCSVDSEPIGDMQVDCSGTTGDCTICGVRDPDVTIVNTQACTANSCSCGKIESCN